MTARVWTVEDVRALGVRTDLPTAAEIIVGVSRSRAWELFHANQLPFPTLRVGRRVVVPVAALLRLLEIEPAPNTAVAGAASPATRLQLTALDTGRPTEPPAGRLTHEATPSAAATERSVS